MTLVFVLIVVTVMLMMLQKLVARIPPDAQIPAGTGEPDGTPDLVKLRMAMQLLVTVVGLVGGGYVVLYGNYSQEVQYWAAGLVGSVFGFWLR